MILNQEQIRRMTGAGGGGAGGGGGFDPALLAGYATQQWVEDNYVNKTYFGRLFTANGTQKVYTSTDGGQTWGNPVTTTVTIEPNEITPSEVVTDGETEGTKIKTVRELSNIQALVGLWTNQYLSALGQNSGGGGGGGGSTTLYGLLDVNIPNPMTQANNGQVLMYNYSQNKWINANLPATGVTSVGMTVPTGFSVSPATISSNGTFAITFASGYSLPTTAKQSNWDTAYGWGNHAQAGYALASNVYSKNDADAKFMTIAAFENLFNALNSSGNKVSHPYSSGVNSIKAMVGLWTQQYISALGQNSSGGGGGASTLSGLNDVQLTSPTAGQGLVYDDQLSKWKNATLFTAMTYQSNVLSLTISGVTKTVPIQGGASSISWDNIANKPTTLSGYGITDAYTKTEVDQKFMTIAAFENLFNAINSSGNKVNHPYSSGVDSIKAMVGLWTQQYLSALGQNSASGNLTVDRLYLDATRYIYVDNGTLYYYNGSTNKQIAFTN